MLTTCINILSCTSTKNESEDSSIDTEFYNICLILDGTDRLAEQNGVPYISHFEIREIAEKITDNGKGTLYVTYIDNDCGNNKFTMFEWDLNRPDTSIVKHDCDVMKEHMERKKKLESQFKDYIKQRDEAVAAFDKECQNLESLAYSDIVAKKKAGSDVNGAINQAVRFLGTSEQDPAPSYIILISDGCDNVGKQLSAIPSNHKLLIVNSSEPKHQYQDLIHREFVSIKQVMNYIF